MGVIVLASAAGAPGTTTLAVGLALSWSRAVLLIDADPSAAQAVLAGFLGGRSAAGKGLVRVAEAHRDRRGLGEAVLDQAIVLADDPVVRRLFVPGFPRPGNAGLFGPVWPDLCLALAALDDVEIDVVVDAGRMLPSGLPGALVERADRVLVVTRTSLRAVAATRSAATLIADQAHALGATPPGLVLVGPGQPYGAREVGAALDLPVVAEVPDDPRSAAVISDGTRRTRQFDRSPLVRSLYQLTDTLRAELQRASDRVGAAGSVGSVKSVGSVGSVS